MTLFLFFVVVLTFPLPTTVPTTVPAALTPELQAAIEQHLKSPAGLDIVKQHNKELLKQAANAEKTLTKGIRFGARAIIAAASAGGLLYYIHFVKCSVTHTCKDLF